MKSYLLVLLLLILILNNLLGEVKNGYGKDIPTLRVNLQSLKNILYNNHRLSYAQKRIIKEKIRTLVNVMVYYEITETLLEQFRTISPGLYNQIDTLKDCKGRIIDVYVKFIPKEQAQFHGAGMTSFKQAANDLNSCNSEYGEGSVSIKIWMLNKALRVLSHEFGHVKYQVPNLISYVEFYREKYPAGLSDPMTLGHRPDDLSGKMALMFEERFRENYVRYLKHDSNAGISPLALISPIKENLLQSLN